MVSTQYTHLKKDEKTIAKRFREQYDLGGEYIYDVHLDVPMPPLPAWWTKEDRKNFGDLKAKRIDLLVKCQHYIWVIEITPKLSKAPLGGVLAYKDLYQKQFSPIVPLKMGVVVEVDDSAYHPIYEKLGVKWWVV